ncbi:ferritin-like domain-containing protein [Thiorhodovibrio frisius]|uniref:Bacterioferritin n=1 Tax=Thiorhodovibrio frisius TaxID=631362 RepID=H8YWN9_9GAMM|nr:ferritin-like domain-containing protein [Thiorhodovibrio frisius]EIC22865.1 bacterioferritin (cytochrome b1) [Thiorhodovibrio frisius]WPL22877.1 Bacterioferritin [Thiorhodovibrio frisius]
MMHQPGVHPRTLGYLGRALSLEYSAVQQYMTQAALTEAWGLREAADRFRAETVEEMRHAERIVKRMLGVGVVPNASQLRPVAVADSLVGLLQQDAVLEAEIVALYDEATRFCRSMGEMENAEFFQGLLNDEMAHAEEVDTWLKTLGAGQHQGWNERAYF